MKRPYIICHMVTSLDGKATGDFLSQSQCQPALTSYYRLHREFKADGFACGATTMNESFTHNYHPDLSLMKGKTVLKKDYIAEYDHKFFAVSFDTHGHLGWKHGTIQDEDPGYDGAHVIEVLSENVQEEYLVYLRSISASYIFAGKDQIDLSIALDKLYNLFGIHKLLLEGGPTLNASFIKEKAVDELSLVMAPVCGNGQGKTVFADANTPAFALSADNLTGGVWIRGVGQTDTSIRKIRLADLIEALQNVSDEYAQFYDVHKEKVEIVYNRNLDTVEENSSFIKLPDRYEINEYSMMEDYAYNQNSKVQGLLLNALKGSGAFRRFRQVLSNNGLEDDWYNFRDECYNDIALSWCEDNDLVNY